jgi:hypothetical protein
MLTSSFRSAPIPAIYASTKTHSVRKQHKFPLLPACPFIGLRSKRPANIGSASIAHTPTAEDPYLGLRCHRFDGCLKRIPPFVDRSDDRSIGTPTSTSTASDNCRLASIVSGTACEAPVR